MGLYAIRNKVNNTFKVHSKLASHYITSSNYQQIFFWGGEKINDSLANHHECLQGPFIAAEILLKLSSSLQS